MVQCVGFIGFGEAAFAIAKGLKQAGLKQVVAYDKFSGTEPQSRLIRQRAQEASVRLLESLEELVHTAEIVISAVSATAVVALAQAARPHLGRGQIYVDINAASPMTKQNAGEVLSPVALFVDGAVMAPVPQHGHKVPISLSGPGARAFAEQMAPFGMNLTVMEGPAGTASASKMIRSIFMKGFVTLLLETMVAGHKYGVEDDVLSSVVETLTSGPLPQIINGLVTRGVIHSERREHEMDEVLATLDALQVDSTMSKATKAKLQWCTGLKLREHFNGIPPADFHEILTALEVNAERGK